MSCCKKLWTFFFPERFCEEYLNIGLKLLHVVLHVFYVVIIYLPCFVYSWHGRQGKWLCWHQKVLSQISIRHCFDLKECVKTAFAHLMCMHYDEFIQRDPTAQWRTVSCRTLPTGALQTLLITSKQQGLRSKPQLSRIRLECSSCSKFMTAN